MKRLNLPNKLTLLRVALVPGFVVFMMIESVFSSEAVPRIISAVLFLLCALTDAVDGMIARKRGLVTDLGKFLDPIADKFMIISAMMAFCASSAYENIRLWVLIAGLIVVLRELAVTSLRLLMAGRQTVVAAALPGKLKTVTQTVFVAVAMLEPVIVPQSLVATYVTLALMVFMTLYSGFCYVKHYWPVLTQEI